MIPNRWYHLYAHDGRKLDETSDKDNLLDKLELGKHGDTKRLLLLITDANRVVKKSLGASSWLREERAMAFTG